MNNDLKHKLINIASEKIPISDRSHDIAHTLRVLNNVLEINKTENADLEILIPAALFHDLITYPKNHPKRLDSQSESANEAEKILQSIAEYPNEKIEQVKTCIVECSFSKDIMPKLQESKILQDADALEATGAIAIMRTFCSSGQMQREFYNTDDPFCETRKPDPSKYAIDLFYQRLLITENKLHTHKAKEMAKKRGLFLKQFLEQLKSEI
jgi:uncharacterized protein